MCKTTTFFPLKQLLNILIFWSRRMLLDIGENICLDLSCCFGSKSHETNTNLLAQIIYFQLICSQIDFYTGQGGWGKSKIHNRKIYKLWKNIITGLPGGKATNSIGGSMRFLHKLGDWAAQRETKSLSCPLVSSAGTCSVPEFWFNRSGKDSCRFFPNSEQFTSQ